MPLAGKAVLLHAIDTFAKAMPKARTVVVLSDDGMSRWNEIAAHNYANIMCVKGGAARSESVANAINAISGTFDNESIVMIHDGARPLVNADMICNMLSHIRRKDVDAVLPVMPLTEALAINDGDYAIPTDRIKYCNAQTPQVFKATKIKQAYDLAKGDTMADDAAIAAKYADIKILKVAGHAQNIKITNPNDLEIAKIYLRNPLPYRK